MIIDINKKTNKFVNCLLIDDYQETNSFLIANHFNKLFSSIAEKIERKIVPSKNSYKKYLSVPEFFPLRISPLCHALWRSLKRVE